MNYSDATFTTQTVNVGPNLPGTSNNIYNPGGLNPNNTPGVANAVNFYKADAPGGGSLDQMLKDTASGQSYWLYETAIITADPSKTLQSVTISGVGASWDESNTTAIFAISGDAVPEPGVITLLVTGLIGLLAYAWRKRR